jgi:hypothetical protein
VARRCAVCPIDFCCGLTVTGRSGGDKQGSSEAQYNLGILYSSKRPIRADDPLAFKQPVCVQSRPGTAHSVQEPEKAYFWYECAAENGHTAAMGALGLLLKYGHGCSKVGSPSVRRTCSSWVCLCGIHVC